MNIWRLVYCWLAALSLTVFTATAQEDSTAARGTPATDKDKGTYYFISHTGAGDPFWVDEFRGARLAAKELGINLRIVAPDTPTNTERQLELLDLAIAPGTKAIATTITDKRRFSVYLKKAQRMGIPVIAYNTLPTNCDRTSNPFLAYVGMDDYAAGKTTGREALKRVKKRLLIVNFAPSHSGLQARVRGIIESFNPSPVEVDVLNTSYDPEAISKAFLDYLKDHPDLDGVISLGVTSLRVIAPIIKSKGLNIYLGTFDYAKYESHYLKQGLLDLAIDQQPLMQGYLAVTLMYLRVKYSMTPPDIDTGNVIIDATRIEQIKKLSAQHIR